MMDWADEIEKAMLERWIDRDDDGVGEYFPERGEIAAALRKAKSDGYLLCGTEWADTSSPMTVLAIAAKVAAIKQGE